MIWLNVVHFMWRSKYLALLALTSRCNFWSRLVSESAASGLFWHSDAPAPLRTTCARGYMQQTHTRTRPCAPRTHTRGVSYTSCKPYLRNYTSALEFYIQTSFYAYTIIVHIVKTHTRSAPRGERGTETASIGKWIKFQEVLIRARKANVFLGCRCVGLRAV